AEDGIRDRNVTGVQTCALPIYHVYVMASRSRVLYVGVTNDLPRRVDEHKRGLTPGFTSRYRVTRLVYFEEFADIRDAIARKRARSEERRVGKERRAESVQVTVR